MSAASLMNFQRHARQWFGLTWMIAVAIVQVAFTLTFVSLFFISHDFQLTSRCILFVNNLGYAQYDLISLGLLIAGPVYQCILCLETLFHRQASSLFVMMLFQLWLIIYSAVQSYQYPKIIQTAASCQFNNAESTTSDGSLALTTSPSATDNPVMIYSIVGITCVSFLFLLILAIYHRKVFQQPMDPVHGALANLLKLDFYLRFAYAIEFLPLPLMMKTISNDPLSENEPPVSVEEIGLIFGLACVMFILAWGMVLVTWQPFPWWRVVTRMAILAIFCLASIVYLCYRLVRFILDPRTVMVRYAMIFTSLCLIIVLLLTMSIVTTCAVRQWQSRHQLQQITTGQDDEQKQYEYGRDQEVESRQVMRDKNSDGHNESSSQNRLNDNDNDSIQLYLTPQVSTINY